MKKMRFRDAKLKLSLFISIIGVLFLVVGSSYAILQDSKISESNQVINVGNVKLELNETNNGIEYNDLTDMTDDEGIKQDNYYSFSIKNTGDTTSEYNVFLIKDETKTNSIDEKYIKVGLEINETDYKIMNLKEVNNLIHNDILKPSEENKYKLWVWLDEEEIKKDPIDENSTLNLKLKVEATQYLDETANTKILYNTISDSVKTSNISYQYINGANKTVNGVTYNNNDNGVFLYDGTDDNNGRYSIYYYRGNVTNNNVLFGGFCWKIVRTTSTGGVKLIYNGVPSSDGSCNNTGTASQLEEKSSFNDDYDSPADVGYMYDSRYIYKSKSMINISDTYMYGNDVTYSDGTYTLVDTKTSTSWSSDYKTLADGYHYTCLNSTGTCSSVYYIIYFGRSDTMYYLTLSNGDTIETAKDKMFANRYDSSIKTTIDNWYKNNLTNYTDMLENTIFCTDRSFSSGSTGGPLSNKDTNSTSVSYFAGYEREYVTYSPSLQCVNQSDRFSLKVNNGGSANYGNNALTYPVGLLTSDEVLLAGGQNTSNSSYYLNTGEVYWLGSPGYWYASEAYGYRINADGKLYAGYYVIDSLGVRPVISLKEGTRYEPNTDGTTSNPYVIK